MLLQRQVPVLFVKEGNLWILEGELVGKPFRTVVGSVVGGEVLVTCNACEVAEAVTLEGELKSHLVADKVLDSIDGVVEVAQRRDVQFGHLLRHEGVELIA